MWFSFVILLATTTYIMSYLGQVQQMQGIYTLRRGICTLLLLTQRLQVYASHYCYANICDESNFVKNNIHKWPCKKLK